MAQSDSQGPGRQLQSEEASPLGTFVIHTEEHGKDWSGTVVWAQGRESRRFHSALDLLRIIDSAITPSAGEPVLRFSAGEESSSPDGSAPFPERRE